MKHGRLARRLILPICLALGACAHQQHQQQPSASTCPAGQQAMRSETIYFGLKIPAGGMVSEKDWSRFLAEQVTPRFPAGFTVWAAQGQWRGASGEVEQEPSRVLAIVHGGTAAEEQAIRAVQQAYKSLFKQEAVLRVSGMGSVCASF